MSVDHPGFARLLVPVELRGSVMFAASSAVDYLAPLPPQCNEYPDVAARLREMRLYTGPYTRYAHHRASDSAGGSKLVLPPFLPCLVGWCAWSYADLQRVGSQLGASRDNQTWPSACACSARAGIPHSRALVKNSARKRPIV